jgi:hypothetical protein
MGKQSIVVVGALLMASGCGARQSAATQPERFGTGLGAVYACETGPIVVIAGDDGPALVDGAKQRVLEHGWSDDDGDHFLSFERQGQDKRPVAVEYTVPKDRSNTAHVRVYDRAAGSHFRITARARSWRITGEPSMTSSCTTSHGVYALSHTR